LSLDRLEITPFAGIVGELLQNRRTGTLNIIHSSLRKVLYWSQGDLVLIASAAPEDSLGDFLVRRGVIGAEIALQLTGGDPTDAVSRFHEAGLLDLSRRQTLLREWIAAQFVPLFALDEGTTAFTDDEAIAPEKRVFLQSTAVLALEGVRAITNGLVLRRCLGDLKREIEPGGDAVVSLDALPLQESERRIAESLSDPITIENFLKQFPNDSVGAAKVIIAMLTVGVFQIAEARRAAPAVSTADTQRDLELLAAIGANDQRSLRAVALSRHVSSVDHYQLLDIPRAATRAQILAAAEAMKKQYEPSTFPEVVRESVTTIQNRIDEALHTLGDAAQRQTYDKLLQQRGRNADEVQRGMTQRSIAEQNFRRARDLSTSGDYYGAIVLLKQAVKFAPEHAEAWNLLGACQERNPKWRRDAAESFQRALSIDPNFVDALISLGDLYGHQGLTSRAQSCYDDAMKIAPDNQQAKSRLQALKKR
jgi:tetratricopeptide (TPR) repeat protein